MSNEMEDSPNLPLLLSLGAQSTLGLQKDTRKGTCYIPDMGAFVKLYEVVGSELRAICISEFYDVLGPVTPAAIGDAARGCTSPSGDGCHGGGRGSYRGQGLVD